jgi:N-acetylglucosaminyl-diphospho-decaprenol L-rhamnosyltransferase
MIDLAVIIVSWNTRDLVLNALRSLVADVDAHGPEAAVYVIDNASKDGTVGAVQSAFPQVHLIASEQNLGFAWANNHVLRHIGFGEDNRTDLPNAVYLLNSDTITQPKATRQLYDVLMSDATIGLVGAQLAYDDGSFQHSAFAFPDLRQLWVEFFPIPGRFIEGRFNGRYPRALYDGQRPFTVDCVLGATMMLRREVVQQTGMFDPQFFMYCEEIDWAWRIHKAGWAVQCVPTAHVTHLAGQSTSQIRTQSFINLWTSRLRLFDKYYPAWKRRVARWMITAGMRRKIRQAEGMMQLSLPERVSLVGAYETVYEMALKS